MVYGDEENEYNRNEYNGVEEVGKYFEVGVLKIVDGYFEEVVDFV
nr:hypothetical protein [Staphylococcus epidermidis]